MKKTLTTVKGWMVVSFCSLLALPALAEVNPSNNLGEVKAGEVYTLEATDAHKGDYYTYQPTEDGLITVKTNVSGEYTQIGFDQWGSASCYFFYQKVVEPGETYYMMMNYQSKTNSSGVWEMTFPVNSANEYLFVVSDEIKDEYGKSLEFEILTDEVVLPDQGIVNVIPTPGEPFDYQLYQDINIYSTSNIESFGTATFQYGSESVTLNEGVYENVVRVSGPPSGQWLTVGGVSYQDFLALFDLAAAEGGCKIVIEDVMANGVLVSTNDTGNESVSVENGTVTINYTLQQAPKLVSENFPTTFLSYWPEGSADALATLTFSQNIASVEKVEVSMGRVTPGAATETEYTTYTVPSNKISIEGNTVTIDFSGVQRTGSASTVTVVISNVMDENGLVVNDPQTASALFRYISYSVVSDTPNYIENPLVNMTENMPSNDIFFTAQVTWNTQVEFVSDDAVVEVSKDGQKVGDLTAQYMSLQGTGTSEPSNGIETLAEAGDTGRVLNLAFGSAGLMTGEGTYTLSLPEGLVKDADGNINKAETITVEIAAPNLAEGEVSPVSGTEFENGEEVKITISYNGTVEKNYSEDAPLMVYATTGEAADANYDKTFTWDDEELSISGSDVVINLGTELKAGYYMLTFRQSQVIVDEVENAEVEYTFSVAEAASADTWQTVTLEKPFEASEANPAWIIEPNEYSGAAYIVSDNPTNLINEGYKLLFLDDAMESPYDVEAVEGEDGNYVYTIEFLNTYEYPAYFYYNGAEKISFTLYNEEYKSGEEEDNDVLTFGDEATFNGLDQTSVKFQTGLDEQTTMSAVSNSAVNLKDYIKLIVPSIVEDWPDTEFTPTSVIKMQDGNLAYYFDAVGTSVMTFQCYSFDDAVTITFQQGKVEGTEEGATTVTPIEIDEDFTATENTAWSYIDTEADNYEVYLLSDSKVNLIESGALEISAGGWTFPADDSWEAVAGSDGFYAYNGVINIDTKYVFTYYGTESVTFTLKKGTYTENGEPKFLEPATCLTEIINADESNPVVILTWGVDVTLDVTKSVQVFFGENMLGALNATLMEVKAGENGSDLYIKFGEDEDDAFNKGAGTYTFNLPAGLVSTADGYINDAETIEVTVEGEWSGVSAIETEAALNGVYNLQGVKVSDSVKNLNNGIYIINGKKVMIRK